LREKPQGNLFAEPDFITLIDPSWCIPDDRVLVYVGPIGGIEIYHHPLPVFSLDSAVKPGNGRTTLDDKHIAIITAHGNPFTVELKAILFIQRRCLKEGETT